MRLDRHLVAAGVAVATVAALLYWNPAHAWRMHCFRDAVHRTAELARVGDGLAIVDARLLALVDAYTEVRRTDVGSAVVYELVFREPGADDSRLLFGHFRGHTYLPPYSYAVKLTMDRRGRVASAELTPTYD